MKRIILLAICLCPITAFSQSMNAKVELNPVGSFEVTTKTIRGSVSKKDGKLVAQNIRIPVRNLTSSNETRDHHLKEKLEMKKNPNIIIEKAIGINSKGTALIKLRGVSKKVSFNYTQSASKVDVSFKLNLKEFGISGINYMGVGVQDIVNVTATLPIK